MKYLARWALIPALLAGWLAAVGPAGAAAGVKDNGNFFGKDTVRKADGLIREIKERFHKDVLVTTFTNIPGNRKEEYEAAENKNRFYSEWVRELGRAERVDGVTLLIVRRPKKHFEIGVTGAGTLQRAFTRENIDGLRDVLMSHLKQDDYEGGLIAGLDYIGRSMRTNLANAPAQAQPRAHTVPAAPAPHHAGINPLGWVCFGLVALGVVWLIIGLIRSFTGGGGGYGRGYGPGGYGPGGYGGGGGGGFMSGLLGGMFGAVAGDWMYHNFLGGGGGWGGGSSAYGATPDNTGGADQGGDFASTGGDFGNDQDQGGGDFGGGGGDYSGGGGDFGGGGGGDFGGGGGDFGGGGGDFGGGGGDF
jgi:uncharacterized protein